MNSWLRGLLYTFAFLLLFLLLCLFLAVLFLFLFGLLLFSGRLGIYLEKMPADLRAGSHFAVLIAHVRSDGDEVYQDDDENDGAYNLKSKQSHHSPAGLSANSSIII